MFNPGIDKTLNSYYLELEKQIAKTIRRKISDKVLYIDPDDSDIYGYPYVYNELCERQIMGIRADKGDRLSVYFYGVPNYNYTYYSKEEMMKDKEGWYGLTEGYVLSRPTLDSINEGLCRSNFLNEQNQPVATIFDP